MTKKTIIFLSYMPLRKKFYKDFFISDLQKSDFNVEYWDLTEIYFPGLKMEDKLDSKICIKINRFNDLKNQFKRKEIKEAIFISYMTYDYRVISLFRLLTINKATLAFFKTGQFPSFDKLSIKSKLKNYSYQILNFRKVKHFIVNKFRKRGLLYKKWGLIKEYDIVFYTGDKQKTFFSNKTINVPINLNDYDNYLKIKDQKNKIILDKYCVFLDEGFVNHPDRKMLGWKSINANIFYKKLNLFFKIIENQYNCKVIIAASPKVNYLDNPFDGRQIFKFKTNELVKDCLFSIAVASTSISYPVIYKKPIIFFSYSEFEFDGSLYDKYPILLSQYLDCYFYLIDSVKKGDNIIFNDVNIEKYNLYKNNFISSPVCKNKETKDIVIDVLRKYFITKNNE
jgi:hypothetical protein